MKIRRLRLQKQRHVIFVLTILLLPYYSWLFFITSKPTFWKTSNLCISYYHRKTLQIHRMSVVGNSCQFRRSVVLCNVYLPALAATGTTSCAVAAPREPSLQNRQAALHWEKLDSTDAASHALWEMRGRGLFTPDTGMWTQAHLPRATNSHVFRVVVCEISTLCGTDSNFVKVIDVRLITLHVSTA